MVIEQEPEETKGQEDNNVNTKSSSSKVIVDDAITGISSVGKDASDGFETASEGEVDDDDDDNDGDSNEQQHQQQQNHQNQQQQQINPIKDESYEDALNDEELKQKALSQANDAKLEGNKLFGDGLYEEALSQYEFALQVTPEIPSAKEIRSTCYANRGICFLKQGKYADTIKECTKALELNPEYLKAVIRRGEAHEKLEHFDEAIADMEIILKLDPSNVQAKRTIARLKPMADEKREKMKEEMIGKLKEMGNSVLGRFGMSVDNFKAVKDPNTGSYSISFQR